MKITTSTTAGNNRQIDTHISNFEIKVGLPKIDWKKIGQSAPVLIPIGQRTEQDPLPQADWVIITWTSAEWQALDHVFIDSQASSTHDSSWRNQWHQYSRDSDKFIADKKSGELWGKFRLVSITDLSGRPWRVLLFKSNSHLAHSPWIAGLSRMVQVIIEDTQADRLYTIGTAGGAKLQQALGDSVITNTAIIELQRPQNTSDKDNGAAFRCPDWYPAPPLLKEVSDKLLFPLINVANETSLKELLKELKDKHNNDASVASLTLDDFINDGLSENNLSKPRIFNLKDSPLLTTDFYYIADGDSADSFAFLEMDDAVIIREANKLNTKVACIRNISDPIVPFVTKKGEKINENVRADWSGLIYQNFGLYTSMNGALSAWATIAGEGKNTYNPPRDIQSPDTQDPMEIKLVYQVRSCGTCNFFWPKNPKDQVYGPYSAFDFDVNVPNTATPLQNTIVMPWTLGRTKPPSFPNPEISDGCRKAPIMTIGINPNLTAFAPGQNGTAWVYPNFSSDENTNEWAKYAWYYRYRSVYQEKLDFDFIKKYILSEGQIIAEANGKIINALRPDENPTWNITVQYENKTAEDTIKLPGKKGDFPYALLFDAEGPNNSFKKGDILAGRLAVPEGIQVPILQETQGYYMQFVPTLNQFENYIKSKGHPNARLNIGEDVSQLDMVACASPHWTEGFLGNQMKEVVSNCISKNAWVVKQFIQTQPAILYIVSESSWSMFYSIFGNFVDKNKISHHPVDQSYTLLTETTNLQSPVYLRLKVTIDNQIYSCTTRLVITPHFSFNKNFIAQYRLSPQDYASICAQSDFTKAINHENGFVIIDPDKKYPNAYYEIQFTKAATELKKTLQANYPELYNKLEPFYYDPHEQMSKVLIAMYDEGEIGFNESTNNLVRTKGGCKFCVNQYWTFPNECKYKKNTETSYSADFLEKVAAYIINNGNPYKNHKN